MNQTRTRTIALHTLGCKLNQTETATIGRQFQRHGYTIVPFDQKADVFVLNTCSVTEKADRECRQLVRRVRRTSPDAFVAVVGCYAQLRPEEIASLTGVDLIAGTAEKFSILDHVARGRSAGEPAILRSTPVSMDAALPSHSEGIERTRAFLKVQDGCDYTCSFCTIPLARGGSRSIPADEIVKDASHLAGKGFREIVLTGVNTGDYGRKNDGSLLRLLKSLVRISGIERIRISSVEPNLLTDDLLDFWIGHEKICKHWHIPMQSGSPAILKAMRRRYGRGWYADRIGRIHEAHPRAGIGADIIVGFPGEADEHFEETLAFVKDLPLTYLHVFPYSRRPSTDAAEHEHHVEPAIRTARSARLRAVGERKKRAFNEQFVGRTVRVLVEGRGENGKMTGLSEEYVRVWMESGEVSENDLVDVSVLDANVDGCSGVPVPVQEHPAEVEHELA